ncbi:MAG: alpha/beta fold hydrolase [Bacteroidota bacterium]
MKLNRKSIFRKTLWALLFAFVVLNVMAFFHAIKFTRFAPETTAMKPLKAWTTGDKVTALFLGVGSPKPANDALPSQPFETVEIKGEKRLEAWHIRTENAVGTVVLFHGHKGKKSSMLDKSDEFLKMGFNTLLVDFRGSGGSEGYETTIGYREAEDVLACFDYLKNQGEKNIVLFGTSMGAAAVMRAMATTEIQPVALILECPFGSMYEATCGAFRKMKMPATFPLAGLLVFWGGVQNGFWAFSHEPDEYAKSISCPTLLLWGEKDIRVLRSEMDAVFENLQGDKQLIIYPEAGHENYLVKYREEWVAQVKGFLKKHV